MTKQEWKEKFLEVLASEPKMGKHNKEYIHTHLMEYLDLLDKNSDPFYGISNEIIIAIEKHLDL